MGDEWIPYGSDDPLKAEVKREVIQDLEYRDALKEYQRQAEAYYLKQFPHHREVLPLARAVVDEYLQEHPEYRAAGAPREKVAEAIKEIGTRVDQRLAGTGARSASGEDWREKV